MIRLVGKFLIWINHPLAHAWGCLSGGTLSVFLHRILRLRRLAGDMVDGNLKPTLPVRMQVETTDICNFRCVMCTREVLDGMSTMSMSFEAFKILIDDGDPFYVTMNGLGEPLIDKTIFEKLRLLHSRKIMTSMPTNGTYIRRDKLANLAVNLPDVLQLSIDGATKQSFEAVRKLSNFESVIDNYRTIAVMRANGETRRGTSIRILYALQRRNLFDYREMFRLIQTLPDVTFNLVPVFDYDAEGTAFKDVVPKLEDISELHKSLRKAIEEAETKEERDFYKSWENASTEWLKSPNDGEIKIYKCRCLLPWYTTYIDAKGQVFPCCYLTNTDHVMGNINDVSFREIWHDKPYVNFRNRIKTGRENLMGCRTCPRNHDRLLNTLTKLKPFLSKPVLTG